MYRSILTTLLALSATSVPMRCGASPAQASSLEQVTAPYIATSRWSGYLNGIAVRGLVKVTGPDYYATVASEQETLDYLATAVGGFHLTADEDGPICGPDQPPICGPKPPDPPEPPKPPEPPTPPEPSPAPAPSPSPSPAPSPKTNAALLLPNSRNGTNASHLVSVLPSPAGYVRTELTIIVAATVSSTQ